MRLISSLHLEARQKLEGWKHATILAGAIATGMAISMAVLVAAGIDVGSIYREFIFLTFFDRLGLSSVLVQLSPLLLVGLAAAAAFRVNFWNIGIHGQFFWGAIGATIPAIYDLGPPEYRIYLMCALGALLGGCWAIPPALLKLRLGVNEVISTLLLNYIAVYFVLNQIYGAWQDPNERFPHSETFDSAEKLPLLGWGSVHSGLILSFIALLVVWWSFERTRFGVFARFVGTNPSMAEVSGISVARVVFISVFFSGALAGLAGFVVAAATEFRLTATMAGTYGFSGIVIAFLARNNALAILIAAFLTAGLYTGGQSIKVFYGLPPSMISLVLAIILLSVASSEFLVRYRVRRIATAAVCHR